LKRETGRDSFISRLFQTRDELSFRNIRGGLWPVLLVFPLSVIIGDLRYFDLKISLAAGEIGGVIRHRP
jgi:hypothetical protein